MRRVTLPSAGRVWMVRTLARHACVGVGDSAKTIRSAIADLARTKGWRDMAMSLEEGIWDSYVAVHLDEAEAQSGAALGRLLKEMDSRLLLRDISGWYARSLDREEVVWPAPYVEIGGDEYHAVSTRRVAVMVFERALGLPYPMIVGGLGPLRISRILWTLTQLQSLGLFG